MFTGIVESLGTVVFVGEGTDTRRLAIACGLPVEHMPIGASVAVDGVCLTMVERSSGRFAADLGPETLARTTLARLKVGDRVHLERPLVAGDPLAGHIVAGHVDGTGVVVAARPRGEAHDLEVAAPEEIARYIVSKGSVAIDGVSLTVNTTDGNRFGVTLVPHTLAVTLLGQRAKGTAVNLEADLIAKHVDRLVGIYVGADAARLRGGAR